MAHELPDSRKVWQGSTIIYKLDPNKVEGESESELNFFSEGGFNVGPFGVGRALIAGIKVNEEGIYRFDHIISLVDSVQKKEERHVVARTRKIHVKPTFDNSTLRLGKTTHFLDSIQLMLMPSLKTRLNPTMSEAFTQNIPP